MGRGRLLEALAVLTAMTAAGCAGASLPKLPMPTSAAYSETPIEIYTRIARGAMACWFGSGGPLKQTHIFNADVAPPSENAGAEIVIHERDPAAPSPRSLRAFRIAITRAPEGTFVASENLRIAEPLASSMKDDVQRWAGGVSGCNTSVPQTWSATASQPNGMTADRVPVVNSASKSR